MHVKMFSIAGSDVMLYLAREAVRVGWATRAASMFPFSQYAANPFLRYQSIVSGRPLSQVSSSFQPIARSFLSQM